MRYKHSGQRVFNPKNTDPRLRTGLAAHYIGLGSGRTLPDLSGYGKHGTFVGNPQWALNKNNNLQSWKFNRSTDYITTPQLWTDTPTQYFVSLWAFDPIGGDDVLYNWRRSANTATWFEIQGQFGNWRCFAGDGSNPIVSVQAGTQSTTKWQHLLMVRDGNTVTLYVDGTQVGTSTGTIGTITMAGGEYPVIGAQSGDFSKKFGGWISDVRCYKRLPSLAEIKILSNPTYNFIIPSKRYSVPEVAVASSIKSFFGVPIAEVKTFNNMPIAEVKTFNGINNI